MIQLPNNSLHQQYPWYYCIYFTCMLCTSTTVQTTVLSTVDRRGQSQEGVAPVSPAINPISPPHAFAEGERGARRTSTSVLSSILLDYSGSFVAFFWILLDRRIILFFSVAIFFPLLRYPYPLSIKIFEHPHIFH